jgi:cell fate regulator YaaT (PSP1 superfamily)
MTPEGKGKVVELNVLSQVVKVRLFEHNKTVEFAGSEL